VWSSLFLPLGLYLTAPPFILLISNLLTASQKALSCLLAFLWKRPFYCFNSYFVFSAFSFFRKAFLAWCHWLTHVSLATWEVEIRRIVVWGQPRGIVLKTPISKVTRAKWTGGVAQVVEWLLCKCKALSLNSGPTQKQNKKAERYSLTLCIHEDSLGWALIQTGLYKRNWLVYIT
jgi:hypothetical protein